MGELGGDATEIVPHTTQNALDLSGALFGKRGAQVVAPDSVFGEPRPDRPQESGGKIRHAVGIKPGNGLEHHHGQRANDRIGGVLEP